MHSSIPKPNETSDAMSRQNIRLQTLLFQEKVSIVWGWFWRYIIVIGNGILLSFVTSYIVGGLLGIFLVMIHVDVHSLAIPLQIVGVFIGLVFNFFSTYFLIVWLTKVKIGRFRIIIVLRENNGHHDKMYDSPIGK